MATKGASMYVFSEAQHREHCPSCGGWGLTGDVCVTPSADRLSFDGQRWFRASEVCVWSDSFGYASLCWRHATERKLNTDMELICPASDDKCWDCVNAD